MQDKLLAYILKHECIFYYVYNLDIYVPSSPLKSNITDAYIFNSFIKYFKPKGDESMHV